MAPGPVPGGRVGDKVTEAGQAPGTTVPAPPAEPVRASAPAAAGSMTLLAAGVIVHDRRAGRVLLLQRDANALFGRGCWDLPGGKSEPGEPVTATAVRELREETGLVVAPDALRLTHVIHGAWSPQSPSGFVAVVFAAGQWTGEPQNREPGKHTEVRWFPTGALPSPFVPGSAAALHGYLSGAPGTTLRGWS